MNIFRANLPSGADISWVSLPNTDCSEVCWEGVEAFGANLPGSNFERANLPGVNFERANLKSVNFKDARLRKANFREAKLTAASFAGADLQGADFSGADINGADFTGANLKRAILLTSTENANFENANMDEVKVLHTLSEISPSLKAL